MPPPPRTPRRKRQLPTPATTAERPAKRVAVNPSSPGSPTPAPDDAEGPSLVACPKCDRELPLAAFLNPVTRRRRTRCQSCSRGPSVVRFEGAGHEDGSTESSETIASPSGATTAQGRHVPRVPGTALTADVDMDCVPVPAEGVGSEVDVFEADYLPAMHLVDDGEGWVETSQVPTSQETCVDPDTLRDIDIAREQSVGASFGTFWLRPGLAVTASPPPQDHEEYRHMLDCAWQAASYPTAGLSGPPASTGSRRVEKGRVSTAQPPSGPRLLRLPDGHVSRLRNVKVHSIGEMVFTCPKCGASHFIDERQASSSKASPTFSTCCANGGILPFETPIPPEELEQLLTGTDVAARDFQTKIRAYNGAMSFTSFMAGSDSRVSGDRPVSIHGEAYHLAGNFFGKDEVPRYAQLYFYDTDFAVRTAKTQHPELRMDTIRKLVGVIRRENAFYKQLKPAYEMWTSSGEACTVTMRAATLDIVYDSENQKRTFCRPSCSEVAALYPDDDLDDVRRASVFQVAERERREARDLVLAERNGQGGPSPLRQVHRFHPAYFPLHYVLLWAKGTPGYSWELTRREGDARNVSLRDYWKYMLHTRPNVFPTIFWGRRLFQQLLVDAWATIDLNNVLWYRNHQQEIRAASYNDVRDFFAEASGAEQRLTGSVNENLSNRRYVYQQPQAGVDARLPRAHVLRDPQSLDKLGVPRVILPASFTGGDRWMHNLYEDSMALVHHFGVPSYFITMTANPEWREVRQCLFAGQLPRDRPDIVARVFAKKSAELIEELSQRGVLGRSLARCWRVEYQKRGLPHVHILLWLDPSHIPSSPDVVDNFVLAELPPESIDPDGSLTALVQRYMTHGPCKGRECDTKERGADGRCQRGYPMAWQPETSLPADGFAIYRRRDDGRKYDKSTRNAKHICDNRWVVPYNPYLLKRYDCHVNVEWVRSVKVVKYIHKYIFKGVERALACLKHPDDEVEAYINMRYIGPSQAVYRILSQREADNFPSVVRLPVHLPGDNLMYFDADEPEEEVRDRATTPKRSKLEAFFALCSDPRYRRATVDLLYVELPRSFTWKPRTLSWQPRRSQRPIGRLVKPARPAGELLYLLKLLQVTPCPKSYEDLRSHQGVQYDTFREAAEASGKVHPDRYWETAFEEAAKTGTASMLRWMFVIMIATRQLDADHHRSFWEKYCGVLCDDLRHELQKLGELRPDDEGSDRARSYGLWKIVDQLRTAGVNPQDLDLPQPDPYWEEKLSHATAARRDMDYDAAEQATVQASLVRQLNLDQKAAYANIVNRIRRHDPAAASALFFLNGAGGTGKTFVYKALAATFRAEGKIVLCVASTGIAALLLPGGTTAHHRFRIGVNSAETSRSGMRPGSAEAEAIRDAALIIWDEAPAQRRHDFMVVHHLLCELRGLAHQSSAPWFGGCPVVFGGDFAQCLPFESATRADDVGKIASSAALCITAAPFWGSVKPYHLTENMRLRGSGEGSIARQYADWLLRLAYNRRYANRLVRLPVYIRRAPTINQLVKAVYPADRMRACHSDHTVLRRRAILAVRNEDVEAINRFCSDMYGDGTARDYYSVDQVEAIAEQALCRSGIEEDLPNVLDILRLPGLPPKVLRLRVGTPVMVIRNLLPHRGICNGTRMVVTALYMHNVGLRKLDDEYDDQEYMIPRIKLIDSESYPWTISRRQFPLRVCYAMTINKAQGQTLDFVGIDLRFAPFSHGQLNVALSRCRDVENISVLIDREKFRYNTIYDTAAGSLPRERGPQRIGDSMYWDDYVLGVPGLKTGLLWYETVNIRLIGVGLPIPKVLEPIVNNIPEGELDPVGDEDNSSSSPNSITNWAASWLGSRKEDTADEFSEDGFSDSDFEGV